MCGIFGIIGDKNNDAAETTLAGLKKLEYRGYDSWGVSIIPSINDTKIEVDKHIGKIGEAKTNLPGSRIALGHTRWATHGGVTDLNAHPHLDCFAQISVIHNGIVENYQELKEDLKKKGHKFISETDTEVIAHLVEENVKKYGILTAVLKTFKTLVGSNAIAVLDLKSRSIIACRNGSPLVVGFGNGEFLLASDVVAFLEKTNKVHFLDDGEAVCLSEKGISLFDIKTEKEKKLITENINWKAEDAKKGGFPHFLLKEISEQAKLISKISLINDSEIKEIIKKIKKGYKIILVACGTASYAALAGKYFFAKQGVETESYGAYEFLPFAKFCDKKTIFFAISQSGETADTLIAARLAKKQGSHIVSLINARGSTLERLSDVVLPVGAGPEIAVVSTKAFTSQVAILYKIAISSSLGLKKANEIIKNTGDALNVWYNKKLNVQIMNISKQILDQEDMYVVGKHENYPAAFEFALKIKESSYIHGEGFAAGELKHGVITLIQKGTPCFVLLANDNVKQEVLSSAAELKARGGYIIGVSPFESNEFDCHIKTPDLGDLSILTNVIVGQLFGYYLGIGRGVDPDKPRNLAKSVTVK